VRLAPRVADPIVQTVLGMRALDKRNRTRARTGQHGAVWTEIAVLPGDLKCRNVVALLGGDQQAVPGEIERHETRIAAIRRCPADHIQPALSLNKLEMGNAILPAIGDINVVAIRRNHDCSCGADTKKVRGQC
jgi:hypothetical protein